MNTRNVIGHRIVAVEQCNVKTWGGVMTTVDRIILDNGAVLITSAHLTEDGAPIGDIQVASGRRKSPKQKLADGIARGIDSIAHTISTSL